MTSNMFFRKNTPCQKEDGNLPEDWKRRHLNVLNYNVYMRPTTMFMNGQNLRALMIPKKVQGYDVIVFQEAFDDDVRAVLFAGLREYGYPHASMVLGSDAGVEQDGGVIVASKWPIVDQKEKLFGSACSGADCLADKGVLYVKIDKSIKPGESNYFHIFGTHLNDGDHAIQIAQLASLRNFINSQNIPPTEAVLIAGDMNINMYFTPRYEEMLNILGAGYIGPKPGRYSHPFSYDQVLNALGFDAIKNVISDPIRTYFDYVLYSKHHLGITSASFAEVRMLRAYDEWKELETERAMWDLSDHFPIYASYHFEDASLSGWNPGLDDQGNAIPCDTDDDCPGSLECWIPPKAELPSDSKKLRAVSKTDAGKSARPAPLPKTSAAHRGTLTTETGDTQQEASKRLDIPREVTKIYKGVCAHPPPR